MKWSATECTQVLLHPVTGWIAGGKAALLARENEMDRAIMLPSELDTAATGVVWGLDVQ
jgi:hypothetical protein